MTECESNLETCSIPKVAINLTELEHFLNDKYRFLNELLVKDFFEIEAEIVSIEIKRSLVKETLNSLKEIVLLGRDVHFVTKKIAENVFGELKVVNFFIS